MILSPLKILRPKLKPFSSKWESARHLRNENLACVEERQHKGLWCNRVAYGTLKPASDFFPDFLTLAACWVTSLVPLFFQFSSLLTVKSSLNFLFTYFPPVIKSFYSPKTSYSPNKLLETLLLLRLLTVFSFKFTFSGLFFLHTMKKDRRTPSTFCSLSIKLSAIVYEYMFHSYPRLIHLPSLDPTCLWELVRLLPFFLFLQSVFSLETFLPTYKYI